LRIYSSLKSIQIINIYINHLFPVLFFLTQSSLPTLRKTQTINFNNAISIILCHLGYSATPFEAISLLPRYSSIYSLIREFLRHSIQLQPLSMKNYGSSPIRSINHRWWSPAPCIFVSKAPPHLPLTKPRFLSQYGTFHEPPDSEHSIRLKCSLFLKLPRELLH